MPEALNTVSELEEKQVQDPVSSNSLKKDFKSFFRVVMDKIFANDEIDPSEKAETSKENENTTTEEVIGSNEKKETEEELNPLKSTEDELNEDTQNVSAKEILGKTTKPASQIIAPKKETPQIIAEPEPIETIKKEIPKKNEAAPVIVKQKSANGWVIQVAAFQSKTDADKVEALVKRYRFPLYTYDVMIKNQKWYRINVGPFSSPGLAASYKQSRKISQKFKGAFVIKL